MPCRLADLEPFKLEEGLAQDATLLRRLLLPAQEQSELRSAGHLLQQALGAALGVATHLVGGGPYRGGFSAGKIDSIEDPFTPWYEVRFWSRLMLAAGA